MLPRRRPTEAPVRKRKTLVQSPSIAKRAGAHGGLLAAAVCLFAGVAAAAALTPQEQQGKQFYLEGISPNGKPTQVLIGPQGIPIEATTLPCGNCHGGDGLGRPEGAVKPSNITWRELTKSYGHRHDNGRVHGPYSEQSIAETLTYGKDPAGNRLDSTMPRYVMANEDMTALIAYLKRLDSDFDPGVSPERLRIGTLVPSGGRLGELGQAVAGLMQAYVDEINGMGGIFGRKLELVTADFSAERSAGLRNAERLFAEQDVFAVVSPFTAGIDQEISALAERVKMPVVGPLTVVPTQALAVNRYTFHLLSGLTEQGRVLAEFATRQLQLVNPQVAVVHPDGEGLPEAAQAVQEQLTAGGWTQVALARYPAGRLDSSRLVAELQQRGVQAIFFLGTDSELAELGTHIRDAIWTPYLLAPGARVARAAMALPNTFGKRVYLAYPTLPVDITAKGADALSGLQKKRNVPARHRPAQVSAYASLLVLEEGLKRAGRDLSRARLVGSLENLFNFETAITPAISYGPSRRIGALGGYVVAVDTNARSVRTVGSYIRLD